MQEVVPWHWNIKWGKITKKALKCDNLGKERPDMRCVQRMHMMLVLGPIRAR
jgi:hypothetical protein